MISGATASGLSAGSARSRDDGALLLRWRTAPAAAAGPLTARDDDNELAVRLLPSLLAGVVDRAPPDPVHRVATISFMRFSGTDQILESAGPGELADRLHRTLSIAQSAFIAEDIALLCVDCDVGAGKIFCSAGVPVASEDDEGRMLRAARSIVDAGPPLPLQIGINRGHVFAAEVGTPGRAAYSAMGDTTNTAARICGKAPPGSIYVHPSVLEHARTRHESVTVGPFLFKGKAQPQVLYEVGDEIGRRDYRVDDTPFVGRSEIVARLRDECLRAVTGVGGSVVVTGAVGIGKSRVVREALATCPGVSVLAFRAEPYGSTSAYRMFRDPLRSMLAIERAPQPTMAQALTDAVGRLLPGHHQLLALLGDVVHIDVDPSEDVRAILPATDRNEPPTSSSSSSARSSEGRS